MSGESRVSLFAVALLLSCSDGYAPVPEARAGAVPAAGYEVWVVDQSNSPGVSHGGALYVYPDGTPDGLGAPERIDLGGAVTALCLSSTGAAPVRPHMIFFNRTRSHAVLSFVASGHVVVFDAATREPVACLVTTPGAGGARQAHAAFPAPDDSYILVANQNGKLLERIDANFPRNDFRLNAGAAINLAACTTPSGAPCEAPALRPDNAPICPIVTEDSRLAFVTLRGGGLLVVDPRATPMRIVAEYDRTVVHGNGCGGVQAGWKLFLDSGGGTGANMTEFDVYRFDLRAFGGVHPPNTPAPALLYSDDQGHRDAHGMALAGESRYLWVADRAANLAEVFDTRTGRRLEPVGLAGPLAEDPTPDLLDLSPDGELLFVTLRGPTPLSGDPHVSTGSTPGVAMLRLEANGRRGRIVAVHRIANVDAAGIERADPHGIRVRRIPP